MTKITDVNIMVMTLISIPSKLVDISKNVNTWRDSCYYLLLNLIEITL